MEKPIPSSLIGYDKESVNAIIMQKNQLLKTQHQDIEYLRNENLNLKKQLKRQEKHKKNEEESEKI